MRPMMPMTPMTPTRLMMLKPSMPLKPPRLMRLMWPISSAILTRPRPRLVKPIERTYGPVI